MTSEETERFRLLILQQLAQVGDGSLPVPTLVVGGKLAGFTETNDAVVRSALAYLCDKGLVALVAKTLSPENKRYRITAGGTDCLAEAGL